MEVSPDESCVFRENMRDVLLTKRSRSDEDETPTVTFESEKQDDEQEVEAEYENDSEEDEYSYADSDDDLNMSWMPATEEEAHIGPNIGYEREGERNESNLFKEEKERLVDRQSKLFKDYWYSFGIRASQSKSDLPQALKAFQSYLESSAFLTKCSQFGFIDTKFTWKEPQKHLLEAFLCDGFPNWMDFSICLAFHGTSKTNIDSILANGLDPAKRCGQAYGKGEYFGKDPGVSLGYCRGGNTMLVFCVVDVPLSPPKNRILPAGYLVVEESCFQLPIGVLSFGSTSADCNLRSSRLRSEMQALVQEAHALEVEVEKNKIKSKIIELLIKGELELAGKCYKKSFHLLSAEQMREISFFAYKQGDREFVDYYFEWKLPEPCETKHFDNIKMPVEEQQKQAAAAWEKVRASQKV